MNSKRFLSLAKTYVQGTPPDVEQRVRDLLASMPVPVLWLLGKAQTGKSSLIKAVTGTPKIEIGRGFKACTKTAYRYAYPSEEQPLLYFLDTRGLYEPGYDADADMAICEAHAHLLIVVVKANDHALAELLSAVRAVTKRHPEWPVVVVQTCLHECYPTGTEHPLPYPKSGAFADSGSAYADLTRHLERQREAFKDICSTFVPVDFTLPEDGYAPEEYGREQLLTALDSLLPEVAWHMISCIDGGGLSLAYWKKAHPHIVFYAAASATAAAAPLPFIDMPLLTAIQLKMLHSIAGVYSQPLSYERLAEVCGSLGVGFLSRLGWRALLKFLPGGSIAYAAYTAAVTYALGNVFCAYFQYIREGTKPDPETLRSLFNSSMRDAEKSPPEVPR